MNKYEEMDYETRKSEWRGDRLDIYARFRLRVRIAVDIAKLHMSRGDSAEEVLRILTDRLDKALYDNKVHLQAIDGLYLQAGIKDC